MHLSNLKVGTRLALSFGLVLLITVVIAAVGIWRLQELASVTHQLTARTTNGCAASTWRQAIDLNWVRTRAAILDADTSHLSSWQSEIAKTSEEASKAQEVVERLVTTDEGRRLLADIA